MILKKFDDIWNYIKNIGRFSTETQEYSGEIGRAGKGRFYRLPDSRKNAGAFLEGQKAGQNT